MILALAIFTFGLIIGSFLNCVIYRLGKKESLAGRSYCPHCKHQLQWLDLLPVVSFFILSGRCRYCEKKISWQYPLVEIATGFLLLLVFERQLALFQRFAISNLQFVVETLFLFYVFATLIIIFAYDLKHYIIPGEILFPAIVITCAFELIFHLSSVFKFLLSAAIASLFFYIIYKISDEKWMGFGDVTLAILLGLLLSWPNILVAIFFAFALGSIAGITGIILGKKKLTSKIPFAPFLISGTLIAFFSGAQIINWYINLFTS